MTPIEWLALAVVVVAHGIRELIHRRKRNER